LWNIGSALWGVAAGLATMLIISLSATIRRFIHMNSNASLTSED